MAYIGRFSGALDMNPISENSSVVKRGKSKIFATPKTSEYPQINIRGVFILSGSLSDLITQITTNITPL